MDILEYLCRKGLENVLTARRDQEIDFFFEVLFFFLKSKHYVYLG